MTSILFFTEAIYCNIFRYNYIRNKKLFLNFFFNVFNLDLSLNIFQKKYDPDADIFLNFRILKNVIR